METVRLIQVIFNKIIGFLKKKNFQIPYDYERFYEYLHAHTETLKTSLFQSRNSILQNI